ncbi:MAG: hypothetical protein ACTHNS_14355 [Marmoricola sp.]
MDRLDVELEDAELLSEVELTAALIVAANQAEGHLSPEEVDSILGLQAEPPPSPPPGESAQP